MATRPALNDAERMIYAAAFALAVKEVDAKCDDRASAAHHEALVTVDQYRMLSRAQRSYTQETE